MSTTAAGSQQHGYWPAAPWLAVLALVIYCAASLPASETEAGLAVEKNGSPIALTDAQRASHNRSTNPSLATTPVARQAQAFAGLQARWESVWSIDVASAELNEANIDRAPELRARADRGDLDAVVELIGAASWCASAGPLSSQRESADGTRPPPCAERFGEDIASHGALEWAIFRWTMLLANAGFQEALLYASVRGRDQLFAPPLAADLEVVSSLRSQLIGQLQSLAATGSADAASELNSYYMKAVEIGEAAAVEARYYADLTERLDPARTGLVEVTDDWILTRARAPG